MGTVPGYPLVGRGAFHVADCLRLRCHPGSELRWEGFEASRAEGGETGGAQRDVQPRRLNRLRGNFLSVDLLVERVEIANLRGRSNIRHMSRRDTQFASNPAIL